MTGHEPRLLRADELPAASVLLADAFARDPLMAFLFQGNRAHIAALGRLSCEYRMEVGWPVFAATQPDGKLCGVASVSLPDPHGKQERVDQLVSEFARDIGRDAYARYEEYSRVSQVGAPTGRVHYLGMIGVDPGVKGGGYGRRLLQATHDLVDRDPESLGIWLDTESSANVAWYERQGYEVLAESALGDIRVWVMFRPRAAVGAG